MSDFASALSCFNPDSGGTVLNEVRPEWLPGELFLCQRLIAVGLHYLPLDRNMFSERLLINKQGMTVEIDGRQQPVSYLRGRGFTEKCRSRRLEDIARLSWSGKIWLEPPLNWIYHQKWGLALPFMHEYRTRFSDRLRSILPSTSLVQL